MTEYHDFSGNLSEFSNGEEKALEQHMVDIVSSLESSEGESVEELVHKVFEHFGVRLNDDIDIAKSRSMWKFDIDQWLKDTSDYRKSDFELAGEKVYANFYLEYFKTKETIDPRLGSSFYKISPGACSIRENLPQQSSPSDMFYNNFQKEIGTDHWPMGAVELMKKKINNPKYFFITEGRMVKIPVEEASHIEIAMNRLSGHKI